MPGSNTSTSMMLIFIGIGMCFIIYLLVNKDRKVVNSPPEVFSDLLPQRQSVEPEQRRQNVEPEQKKVTTEDNITKYLAPSPGVSEPLEYNSKGPEGASVY